MSSECLSRSGLLLRLWLKSIRGLVRTIPTLVLLYVCRAEAAFERLRSCVSSPIGALIGQIPCCALPDKTLGSSRALEDLAALSQTSGAWCSHPASKLQQNLPDESSQST